MQVQARCAEPTRVALPLPVRARRAACCSAASYWRPAYSSGPSAQETTAPATATCEPTELLLALRCSPAHAAALLPLLLTVLSRSRLPCCPLLLPFCNPATNPGTAELSSHSVAGHEQVRASNQRVETCQSWGSAVASVRGAQVKRQPAPSSAVRFADFVGVGVHGRGAVPGVPQGEGRQLGQDSRLGQAGLTARQATPAAAVQMP